MRYFTLPTHAMSGALLLLVGVMLLGCASSADSAADDSFNASYRCANGQQIVAVYLPPDRARISTLGKVIDMHIARSASGARYVGGQRVWWTKGSGPGSHGTLFERAANDAAGAKITSCVQIDTLQAT